MNRLFLLMGILGLSFFALSLSYQANPNKKNFFQAKPIQTTTVTEPKTELATLAGGCFWCLEPPYDKLDGVLKTTVGYTGGHTDNPTYEDVSYKDTGHLEAIQIEFDPSIISYQEILHAFWRNIDPLDPNGQFCDQGPSYTTAIFTHNNSQKEIALQSKKDHEALLGQPFATPILDAQKFYNAEDYHQDYYKKNPVRYKFYRFSCGRDAKLDKLWADK